MTLGLVVDDDRILLGMKKRGFGKGYWNGFGGKLHFGETLYEGMKRELHEETSLLMIGAERSAFLEFFFEDGMILEGNVFLITEFSGIAVETDEMSPQWFYIKEIPYHSMWEDDLYWMPHVLNRKKVAASFSFTSGHKLAGKKVSIVSDENFFKEYSEQSHL